eukprot:3928983-Rhodomonas_salina.1
MAQAWAGDHRLVVACAIDSQCQYRTSHSASVDRHLDRADFTLALLEFRQQLGSHGLVGETLVCQHLASPCHLTA